MNGASVTSGLAIIAVLALAYLQFKQGRAAGANTKQRSQELDMMTFGELSKAQIETVRQDRQKIDGLEGDVEDLKEAVKKLEAANKVLRQRDEIRDIRELMLTSAIMNGQGMPLHLPALPVLADA